MGSPNKTKNDSRIPSTIPPDLEKQLKSCFEELYTDLSLIIRDYIEASRLEYTRDIASILDEQTQLIETLITRVDSAEQTRLKEQVEEKQEVIPTSPSPSAKKKEQVEEKQKVVPASPSPSAKKKEQIEKKQEVVLTSSSPSAKKKEQIEKKQNQEPEPSLINDENPETDPEQSNPLASNEECQALGIRFSAYREIYKSVYRDVYKDNMTSIMNAITLEFSDYLDRRISASECITWSRGIFSRPVTREKYERLCKCLNHFEPILEYKRKQQMRKK